MERSTLKKQQIGDKQAELAKSFPALWSGMIKDWSQPGLEDRAWLMYSANYLFRTNNIHWAIDPLRLKQRLSQAPDTDLARDLNKLSFVLLTHRHADHLDFELIGALRHLPILWVVPEAILEQVVHNTGLSTEQIINPIPGQCLDIHGIRITPFTGLHSEKGSDMQTTPIRGVPAMAYLIEFKNKRWLFPGDTRTYDASQLPAFGSVDGLFAHLWLGRGCALEDEPPLLDSFCRFCLDLQPRKIILAHLEEVGRAANDYWGKQHAERVRSRIQMLSSVPVSFALLGDSVLL